MNFLGLVFVENIEEAFHSDWCTSLKMVVDVRVSHRVALAIGSDNLSGCPYVNTPGIPSESSPS